MSIQHMSLDWLSSVSEIDGLSFSHIDCHVPVLTPWLHQNEAALQLPENITFLVMSYRDISSVERPRWTFGVWRVSFRVGTSMEPWGTSACISWGVNTSLSTETLKKSYSLENIYIRPGFQVVSKAFLMSKKTTAVNMLLKCRVTWSKSLIHLSVMLWRAWKPNWLGSSKFRTSTCHWSVWRI